MAPFSSLPGQVSFGATATPGSTAQLVVPYTRQPSAGTYTYKLVFHLRATTTATRFRLGDRAPVEVPAGTTILEFTTDTFTTNGPSWNYWALGNANGDSWVFTSCDIYEQI